MTLPILPRTLRTNSTVKSRTITAFVLFAAAFAILLGLQGLSEWTFASGVFLVFAVAALVDVVTARVTLTEDSITVVHNYRRREFARASVVDVVTSSRVGPMSLQLDSGERIDLPKVGLIRRETRNLLLAWIGKAIPVGDDQGPWQ